MWGRSAGGSRAPRDPDWPVSSSPCWSLPGWPVLLALTGVPALLQLLSLPFCPESPRYTLIQKGDEDTARQGTGGAGCSANSLSPLSPATSHACRNVPPQLPKPRTGAWRMGRRAPGGRCWRDSVEMQLVLASGQAPGRGPAESRGQVRVTADRCPELRTKPGLSVAGVGDIPPLLGPSWSQNTPPWGTGEPAPEAGGRVGSCPCLPTLQVGAVSDRRGPSALLPAALRKLRGWADVEDEIEEMRAEDQAERAEGRLSVLNLLAFRPLRWQLVSIVVLMAGQQLSGVNAVRGAGRAARVGGGGPPCSRAAEGLGRGPLRTCGPPESHLIQVDPANVH